MMDGNNLLSGGIDTLNEIKENLLELHSFEAKNNSLLSEQESLEKSIRSMERTVSEEIQSTVKKRRQEIEDTFDDQTHKTEAKLRKTKERRGKRKNHKVSERIGNETATLREENNNHRIENKSLLKQKHVPAFCNTKLYCALYMPTGFSDFLVVLCSILIAFIAIPCGIYFFALPDERILYLVLIYVLTVVVF
ncbi:MAG TPA: hypothetical protein VN131_01800, partial [Mobilitalea sp.]|nr:hypothetical protein [Mobilitalea sp.]